MKNILTKVALGVAVTSLSFSALAQETQETQEPQGASPIMEEQQQPQGQIVQRQDVDFDSIKGQAEQQVMSIDREVGLELSEEQVGELSEAMTIFMVGQYEAEDDSELKSLAKDYEDDINAVLTDEQKETISEHASKEVQEEE